MMLILALFALCIVGGLAVWELRAIRKVLQALCDYDSFVSVYKLKDTSSDDKIIFTKAAQSYG